MQILIQVARGFQGLDSWSTKVPIIILDLKGDPVLFQTARLKPGNIKVKPGGTAPIVPAASWEDLATTAPRKMLKRKRYNWAD